MQGASHHATSLHEAECWCCKGVTPLYLASRADSRRSSRLKGPLRGSIGSLVALLAAVSTMPRSSSYILAFFSCATGAGSVPDIWRGG